MEKVLSFIINKDKKYLLLKGSDTDPQFHKSFWYVVTGGVEEDDKSLIDTVKREVFEETGLIVKKTIDLDWIFEYESLGNLCVEHAFISYVDSDEVILNEESIDYAWCNFEEFINKIEWFGDKKDLVSKLKKYE